MEDEAPLRSTVGDQLTAEGYHVATADDGDTGLELLNKERFDLLIVDIRMPRMDGLAVLREVKARGMQPRIIVLTSVDDLDFAVSAARLGANDYVTKPFDMDQLLVSIRRVLQA
jgi:DNA-binding response OmpR family regulator